MPDDADLLTAIQVAEILKISLPAITNAAVQGRLPYVVVYGRRLYRRADVEAYKTRTQPLGKPKRGRPKQPPKSP